MTGDIKPGNPYALRVPKLNIDDNDLKPGNVVEQIAKQPKALNALIKHSQNIYL